MDRLEWAPVLPEMRARAWCKQLTRIGVAVAVFSEAMKIMQEEVQMSQLPVIEAAIRSRTPISFNYIQPDKDPGGRIGNPHAVFIERLKSGEERPYLDLWQTGGVTDSGKPLPSWRQFHLNGIQNVRCLSDETPFTSAEGYKPESYKYPIAKV